MCNKPEPFHPRVAEGSRRRCNYIPFSRRETCQSSRAEPPTVGGERGSRGGRAANRQKNRIKHHSPHQTHLPPDLESPPCQGPGVGRKKPARSDSPASAPATSIPHNGAGRRVLRYIKQPEELRSSQSHRTQSCCPRLSSSVLSYLLSSPLPFDSLLSPFLPPSSFLLPSLHPVPYTK